MHPGNWLLLAALCIRGRGAAAHCAAGAALELPQVCTVKMSEEDFEVLEDNQVLVQVWIERVGVPVARGEALQ